MIHAFKHLHPRRFLALILAATLLLTGCGHEKAAEETQMQTTTPIETTEPEPQYRAKEGLETMLIMGLDKYYAPEASIGYLNDQQCDFLMLLIMDEGAGTCQILHLNRDTMTEIRRLGVGGGDAGRFIGQLALSHTYGSGGSDSCLNTVKAVSTFLKGVHIDHYVSLTMDAVGILNDLVGGVTVELLDDFTDIDPAMVQGEEYCLHGEQALRYVRSRAGLEDSSNLHRMERQRQYMTALYEKVIEMVYENEDFMRRSLLQISPYFQSDCTVNQLDAMGNVMKDLQMKPFVTIDGEAVKGEEFMEFYADEASLDRVLIELFCEPA